MNTDHISEHTLDQIIAKHWDGYSNFFKRLDTLSLLRDIPEPIPSLKPIAEMPPEPPFGCFRQFYKPNAVGGHMACLPTEAEGALAIDIQLPVVDKDREEFEAWWKQWSPHYDTDKERYYAAWLAARKKD